MQRLARFVFDQYDDTDGQVLRSIAPQFEDIPDFVKSASRLTEEEIRRTPDDKFALIMLDDGQAGPLAGEQIRESLQVKRPPLGATDRGAHAFPALAMTIEVSVLELDARPLRSLGDEPDLDLAGLLEVGLQLPARADVPAEDHPVGRLVGEDARPMALASVDAAIEEATARAWLEHRLGDLDAQQVVVGRLEGAEVLGEDLEGALDRHLAVPLRAAHVDFRGHRDEHGDRIGAVHFGCAIP